MTEQFVQPDAVVSHFHLRPGDAVADFGAGNGYFLLPLAAAVGVEGTIYCCEIQKTLVDTLTAYVRTHNIPQTTVLWCDLEEIDGIPIPDDTLDAAILVNTLFQIEDKSTAVHEMLRTVRPGGKFFVIDWTESFGGLGPQPQDVCDALSARALFEAAGCVLETEFYAGAHHYGLSFRLPGGVE